MEKEKKGLFGQLLEFWMEKIGMGGTDRIGFWHDMENEKSYFAEMGAVASLSQEETKMAFWDKLEGIIPAEKVQVEALLEERQTGLSERMTEEEDLLEATEKRETVQIFTPEVFRENTVEENSGNGMTRGFLWRMPEKERETRRIVPVEEEEKQIEKRTVEETELPAREVKKMEKTQEETAIDIENLMRQMTKKLWEERESCGRRLR